MIYAGACFIIIISLINIAQMPANSIDILVKYKGGLYDYMYNKLNNKVFNIY